MSASDYLPIGNRSVFSNDKTNKHRAGNTIFLRRNRISKILTYKLRQSRSTARKLRHFLNIIINFIVIF